METLLSLLEERVNSEPQKEFLHIWDRNNSRSKCTYEDLYNGARKYAAYFKEKGLKKGEPVFIMLLTRIEFYHAFFGVMMAGGLPVPLHPPIFILEWAEYKEKLDHIYNTSKPKFVLCYSEVLRAVQEKVLKDMIDTENIIVIEDMILPENTDGFVPEKPMPDDCAYIQYTSGSTGLPKGAMLSHSALLNNMKSIKESLKLTPDDIFVSWLPQYHDMGFIGNFLCIIYCSCTICLMPTEYFVMQPTTYLKIMSEYKATLTTAPNFGYVICNKYVNHKKLGDVDLSSLRVNLIGADHIEFNDMAEFNEKFEGYRLDTDAFLPVYGLAESCLAVAFSDLNSSVKSDFIDWNILNKEGRAVSVPYEKRKTLRVISVGKPIRGQNIKICNENGEELPDEYLGEICIKSNMLMNGYHNMPERTEKAFRDGWFITGDLGYMRNGELFFFERKSDIVRSKGKIYRPKDFEHYCWEVEDIKRGKSAGIGIQNPETNEIELHLLVETGTFYRDKYLEIIEELNSIYIEEIGEIPDYIHVVARGSISQTSSGKLQRNKCKEKYINNIFDMRFKYNNVKKEIIFCK